jgi:hypothetical protein
VIVSHASRVRPAQGGIVVNMAATNEPNPSQAAISNRRAAEASAFRIVSAFGIVNNLKGDLALRPVYHQLDQRIEAHVFIAFLAYCLHVTLRCRLRALAGGLTPRTVLEKFKAIPLIDVHLPTTDGRTVVLPRYTQPEAEHKILLQGLKLQVPEQPKPRITAAGSLVEPSAP